MFVAGCVIYYLLTGGHHPFEGLSTAATQVNILRGRMSLAHLWPGPTGSAAISSLTAATAAAAEAADLIAQMIHPVAALRVAAADALGHPLFWPPERRLAFLEQISDLDPTTGAALEAAVGPLVLNQTDDRACSWTTRVDSVVVEELQRHRVYRSASVQDLLRAIRNLSQHLKARPAAVIRALLSSSSNSNNNNNINESSDADVLAWAADCAAQPAQKALLLLDYFLHPARFPTLLIEAHRFLRARPLSLPKP